MTDSAPARVVLVDDNPDMLLLLRSVLLMADGFEVVAEAMDGRAALAAVTEHRPDAIVLDQRLDDGEVDGIDLAPRLLAVDPELVIVLFTAMVGGPEEAAAATSTGIRACLGKQDVFELPGLLAHLLASDSHPSIG